MPHRHRFRAPVLVAASVAALSAVARAQAQDVSAPATLQMYEAAWQTIERRSADIFMAGYGAMWLPPPGKADQGGLSVGYDVYDRFHLGTPEDKTLYGTETGLKTTVKALHRASSLVYTDMIWNHNGFSDHATPGFAAAGGYPGFSIRLQTSNPGAPGFNTRGYNDVDGDFHGAFEGGDWNGRLAGLIDIAQEKNYQFVRSPVPGFANNIPAGTTPAFGRLANVPAESNRRFYPDQSLPGITLTDGGETFTVHPFNTTDPTAGDPVEENATGYLMRHTQWMVQEVGVDGFRLDAVKHMPQWVMNYFDRAVYRAIQKPLLDGSTQHVFSFGEVLDGNRALVQSYIRKNLNTGTIGQVRGNRDALDFPLFFAMRDNLSSNGLANNWNNVVNASQDVQDDGLANNGSQGVAFVRSHDDFGAYLDDVAHAYTLMRPGNAIVYFNAKQFGDGRPFPKDGKRDALGGFYGDTVTTLVNIRNTHGRGNYLPRLQTKETLVYEREGAAVVALSNRLDNGSDPLTGVQTSFAPGQRLIELTGNAADATIDPTNQIDEVLVVDDTGKIDIRLPRNKNQNGVEHGKGYLIYGLPTPVGTLTLSNVAQTIAGETPTAATNGTARLTALDVIKSDSFNVTLQTAPVIVGGWHDVNADGDNAILRINEGLDLNGNGTVDLRSTSNGSITYGFENFVNKRSPLFGGGDGEFVQTIDATQLLEGTHFITVRAFRHGEPGGTPVFSDFRKVIYVDRLKPQSSIDSIPSLGGNNRQVRVKSTDLTADRVHTMVNLPAALTDQQVLALAGTGNRAGQIDRDLFAFGYNSVPNGNNVVTVVTFELNGTYNIQRFTGLDMNTTVGLGLGDLNFNNAYTTGDVLQFETALYAQNTLFNPAADLNADGRIDHRDLFALRDRYVTAGAPIDVVNEARALELRRGNLNGDGATDAADIDHLYQNFGSSQWLYDLDDDQTPADQQDLDVLVRRIFLTEYGDANLDQRVNLIDFNALAANFGATGIGWARADFTGDGRVTLADFNVLAGHFGFAAADGGAGVSPQDWAALASAVPEPACAGAVLLTTPSLLRRSRRPRVES